MYNFLSSIHPNIKTNAVLCFDGIMIPIECFQPELLQELHQEILLKTGFDLLFTTKAFDKHLLDQLGPENVVLNPDSFEVVAEEFEQTHCKIISKGIYIKSDGQNITFYSKQSLRDAYEHLAYDNGKTFINKWTIGNNSIRAYDNMDYYPAPLETPPNIFNLWTVFEAEKYTGSYETHRIGLELFLNHIYILCGNQKNVADYVIKWMAQMIQYPAVKTLCLTLISEQGAGKGTLMKLLEKILGIQKILETTNPNRDVWGQFNGQMSSAFLVILNELSKKDTIDSEGKIKALITDGTISINNKGQNQTTIKSYHRFIITTNMSEPVNTSYDDRRNLIIRASDELKGNKSYFDTFYELLNNESFIRTVYDYLKSIPHMDKFHHIPIPETNYQRELKKLSMCPPEQYLVNLIEYKTQRFEITAKQLFDDFQSFCSESNINYNTTSLKLGVKITNLNINGITKSRNKHGMSYVINPVIAKKHFKIMDDDIFIDDTTNKEEKLVVTNQLEESINQLNNKVKTTKKNNFHPTRNQPKVLGVEKTN